jgi:23S rRNA pseudouridine955/2504/2580 synthase
MPLSTKRDAKPAARLPQRAKAGAASPRAASALVAPMPAPAKVSQVVIDEAHEGQRIDNFLLGQLKGVPKSHVYRILRSGEVRVNKGRVDQTYRLALEDVVRIPPVRVDNTPKSGGDGQFQAKMAGKALPAWRIVFEDDAILAIDKPAGMAVHGGSGIHFGVIEALRQSRPDAKFLELVHRLDRETSGVLLIAKKRSALVALHASLRGDSGPDGNATRIKKHYYALVEGNWPDAKRSVRIKLAKYLTKDGERRVAVDEDDGQESHTIFTRVAQMHGATLLDCDIRTGRTHQIRVHLASLGYPILGDDKYGNFALNKHIAQTKNGGLKRMFLHAHSVSFQHPLTGAVTEIVAPLSADLAKYVEFRKHVGA